ncbi:MAG TPA: hypothetical protein VFU21_19490, partial [Kofleriaceae bacterium]|nr:hypothetical protein [Kofleriaceae bacterium]
QFGVIDFTATALPDGNVLIAGGRQAVDTDFDLVPDAIGEPVRSAYVATLEEVGGAFVAATTSSLAVARAGHTAVGLCDGTILVVGGAEQGPAAERYNPRSDIRR